MRIKELNCGFGLNLDKVNAGILSQFHNVNKRNQEISDFFALIKSALVIFDAVPPQARKETFYANVLEWLQR